MSNLVTTPAECVLAYLRTVPALLAGYGAGIQAVPSSPDLYVTVTDTVGTTDGRDSRSGDYVTHPGIQVRVRHKDFALGYAQCLALVAALAAVRGALVTVRPGPPPVLVRLAAFALTGSPVLIGVDESRRQDLTFNGTVTLRGV